MNNKKEHSKHSNKGNNPQKQHKETWLGNPDDHEPTMKVEKDEINP